MQAIRERRRARPRVDWIRTFIVTVITVTILSAAPAIAGTELPGVVLDPAFDAGEGLLAPWGSSDVQGALSLPDGCILIWGGFTNVQGLLRTGIAMLERNGKLVETFNPKIDFIPDQYPGLSSVARQSDGKLIISGPIQSVNEVSVNRFARINSDGSLDQNFDASRTLGGWAESLTPLADGRILAIATLEESNTNEPLARLNSQVLGEGFVRLDLSPGARLSESSGSLIVLGPPVFSDDGFTTRILPLDENGVPQNEFSTPRISAPISLACRQPDGKFLLVAERTEAHRYSYWVSTFLLRMNPDGTVDSDFHPQTIGQRVSSEYMSSRAVAQVAAVSLESSGKIWIAGSFVSYNDVPRTNLARLHPDGSLDLSFDPGEGPNGRVAKAYLQPSNTMILLGDFAAISGFPRPVLARIFTDGTTTSAIRFREATMIVGEMHGSVDVSVLRYGDARDPIEVVYTAFNRQLGTDGLQFLIRSSLLFEAGETEKFISIPLGNNSFAEDDRKIELNLAVMSHLPRPSPLIMTVLDDEKPGSLDFGFSVESAPSMYSEWPRAIATQRDGQLLLAGTFTTSEGGIQTGMARLRPSGELDPDFLAALESDAFVQAIAVQPDGKIVVAYSTFTSWTIVRLNQDGSQDLNFLPTRGILGSAILVQPDGRILIGGYESSLVEGNDNYFVQRPRLIRLNRDGSTDASFNATLIGNEVSEIALQPDGKILVGGSVQYGGSNQSENLLRLHPDGSVDQTFTASFPPDSSISGFVLQPDGRILVSGRELLPARACLMRLLANGSVDETFSVPFEWYSSIQSILLETTGRILVSGYFSVLGTEEHGRLYRLNSDGSLDRSYRQLPIDLYMPPPTLLALQNDGKALVDVIFRSNEQWPPAGIVRLNADPLLSLGSLRFANMPATTVHTLPGRTYLLQVSQDLSSWSELRRFTATNYVVNVEDDEASRSAHRFYRAVEVSQ